MDEAGRAVSSLAVLHPPPLSKSTYLIGSQCHLRLWRHFYARHLAAPVGETQQFTFNIGHEVGELACRRYPDGHLIAQDHRHVPEALAETRRVLDAGTAPVLFEPAFEHEHVLARPDVLERLPGGGWRLVEVKAILDPKDVHVLDVAIQLWVLRGAGLDVREAGVLTLNGGYVYDGAQLDVHALFKLHPVLDEASALLDGIGAQVRQMRAVLARTEAPTIASGPHCTKPYHCEYHAHCVHNQPAHGIEELPDKYRGFLAKLESAGIHEIKDIPDDFPLNFRQKAARKAVLEGRVQVHGRLGKALAGIKPPVRHLDFETFAQAIPRFARTRPHQPIPFLFSVHAERDGEAPTHTDYLHEGEDDPRPMLVERLLDALGQDGSICVYSFYEGQRLQELVAAVPHKADALAALQPRLFDLCRVVRNNCYHPDFRGSFSLKNVLPALVPGLGYDDMAIADGRTASALYQHALANNDPTERQRTFAALRAYCQRDTLAIVELRKALAHLAGRIG